MPQINSTELQRLPGRVGCGLLQLEAKQQGRRARSQGQHDR